MDKLLVWIDQHICQLPVLLALHSAFFLALVSVLLLR